MIRILSFIFILAIAPLAALRSQSSRASSAASRAAVSDSAKSDSAKSDSAKSDSAAADSSSTRAPERGGGECFRFVFGEWNPPLDAKKAGHVPFPSADSLPQAPGGRDWAFSDSTTRDIQLMLYPSFWPAGVVVRFPHVPRTLADTVRGRAMALVADGHAESPEADAMAWLVPCGR